MDFDDILTPEERKVWQEPCPDLLRPLTPEELRLALTTCSGGGFYFHVVESLLRQPPVKTEPYTPPKEEVPPSTYTPLAHR
jgi:hypothetical protein